MVNLTKIYFLENSFDYNGNDLNSPNIAGSEKTLINITTELAKESNYEIKVFNNTSKSLKKENVTWENINQIDVRTKPDFVICMSDANLFNKLNCKRNYLWSHSVQSLEKFIRKKQLIPFIKYKPIMILEGEYHYKTRSYLTSFYGKKILKIAPDYDFINSKVDLDFIPKSNAIFTTKSDRNLEFLLNAWSEIKNKTKKSILYINPPYNLNKKQIEDGVFLRNKGTKDDLINELKNSRLFLSPGHKTEVFCLAAEEARELCVPIVTMGYGSLYERVDHGITGFVAKNRDEFINFSVSILTDDDLYLKLKKNLIKRRNSRNYINVKNDLIRLLGIK